MIKKANKIHLFKIISKSILFEICFFLFLKVLSIILLKKIQKEHLILYNRLNWLIKDIPSK
jgi:hypothetical protein